MAAFSNDNVDPGLSCPSGGGLKLEKKGCEFDEPSRIPGDCDWASPGIDNGMGTELMADRTRCK